jgi:NAD-dependent deacetylase
MSQERIVIDRDTWIMVLTGAGVSAESGIPTFRGGDGLWENHSIEQVATPEGFQADPLLVWRFYSARRRGAHTAAPNPGHVALAAIEAELDERFLLVTQNVDSLHRRAGSRRLIEMHGNLFQTRCSQCDRPPFEDESSYEQGPLPECERCSADGRSALLRPHIVWFGEMLFPADLHRIKQFMLEAGTHRFVFLAVGTSGLVYPAAGLVDSARGLGAETWLVNLDPPDNAFRFAHHLTGKSGELLPQLFDLKK